MNLTVSLLACATCYGTPGSPMTQGMNAAILTMLGVTGLVLGGCAALIVTLVRRARRHAAFEAELDELLKGTDV
jgi:hypothetical protein